MRNVATPTQRAKSDLIDKFLNYGSAYEMEKELLKKYNHLSENSKVKNIFTKFTRSSKNGNSLEQINLIAKKLIQKKTAIDSYLVEVILVTIVKELHSAQNFNKAGVDYKNDNLFFWFEIKSNDNESYKQIAQLISKYNQKYLNSGIKVSHVIVEDFLGLDIPPDYREIQIRPFSK